MKANSFYLDPAVDWEIIMITMEPMFSEADLPSHQV